MSSNVDRLCAKKGCDNVGKHLCSGCGEEIYCSKECQKAHWAEHKPACKSAVKPESAALLKSLDSLSVKQLKNVMKAKAATFDNKKKSIVLTKLDSIVEKPNLVKFVQEHVNISEVEGLLSVEATSVGSSSSSGSTKAKQSKPVNAAASAAAAANALNPAMPSPTQLRQQAKMMREQPNAVRKANAMFANMTDAQIRQYADQIEQAAADPQMLQEMAKMAQMPPKDRDQLQHIQEGLAGAKPLDAAWIEATVKALKTNPGVFKSMVKGKGAMLGGVTDEQTGSFIDTVSAMDASTLTWIIRGMIFLGSLYQPGLALYNTVDSYTFGSARYLVLFIVLIIAYYVGSVLWFVLRMLFAGAYSVYSLVRGATGGSSATVTETVYQAASSALSSDLTAAATATAGTAGTALKTAGAAAVGAAAAAAATGAASPASAAGANAEAEVDDKYDF